MAKNKEDDVASAEQTKKNDEAARMQAKIEAEQRAVAEAEEQEAKAAVRRLREEQQIKDGLRPAPAITTVTPINKARPGEETVTMDFPRDVYIWAERDPKWPGTYKVQFRKGLQEVPVSLADNWYLKACGVKKYEGRRT